MTKEETAKIIAEVAYDVLRQHDNESIQEADWRLLTEEIATKAAEQLAVAAANAPRRCPHLSCGRTIKPNQAQCGWCGRFP